MPISELMNRTDALKARTKDFAIRIFHLVEALPKSLQGRAVANQIIRSGTSVAANYRAACRARSKREFIARLGTMEDEADESAFWLELIIDGRLLPEKLITPLLEESSELVAIAAASKKTAASRLFQSQIANRKSQIP